MTSQQAGIERAGQLFLFCDWIVYQKCLLVRSQQEQGCLSHFVQQGMHLCPQGAILFHTESLAYFKHTIVSSNPTVLPYCNAIHSVTAKISFSLSCFLTFPSHSQWLHVATWTTNTQLSFVITEKEVYGRTSVRGGFVLLFTSQMGQQKQ